MSVILLKDTYLNFINSDSTTLSQIRHELDRVDSIIMVMDVGREDDLLDELYLELADIYSLLEDAEAAMEKALVDAQDNYEYELKFKPNR